MHTILRMKAEQPPSGEDACPQTILHFQGLLGVLGPQGMILPQSSPLPGADLGSSVPVLLDHREHTSLWALGSRHLHCSFVHLRPLPHVAPTSSLQGASSSESQTVMRTRMPGAFVDLPLVCQAPSCPLAAPGLTVLSQPC